MQHMTLAVSRQIAAKSGRSPWSGTPQDTEKVVCLTADAHLVCVDCSSLMNCCQKWLEHMDPHATYGFGSQPLSCCRRWQVSLIWNPTRLGTCPLSHCGRSLGVCQLQLIDELLPEVAGAPNLGGHNRSGESIKATKAKQKQMQMQQMQSPAMDPATSVALQRRQPAGSQGGNVAQAPSAETMRNSLVGSQEAAWEQAPILVRVSAHASKHLTKSSCFFSSLVSMYGDS